MSEKWSKEELRAAVEAYIEMHSKQGRGEDFVKSHYYSKLADRFERTAKSFEYRMQNISYVYSLMGRSWVSGLRPARNVGKKNAAIIESLISELEGQYHLKVAEFETEVSSYKAKSQLSKPQGNTKPEKSNSTVTTYSRDPKVKAWVLKESDGRCENCNKGAPFVTAEGDPFLEVHHIRRLADSGSDTVSNAIAVCPNCHRELHYGSKKLEIIKSLYNKIGRLIPE